MSDALTNWTIAEIADLMEARCGVTAVPVPKADHYLDIDGKVGKGVFKTLNLEGIHVIAVLPREDGATRLWFEEDVSE